MRRVSLVALPLSLAFAGCPAGVNGQIDGNSVDTLYSAFFVQQELEFPDDSKLTSINSAGVSLLDGCNVATKLNDNSNAAFEQNLKDVEDAEDADAIVDASEVFANAIVDFEKANVPTDFWRLSVGANAVDDGDLPGGEFEIDIEEVQADDVTGGASVCRVNDHPSVEQDDDDLFFVKRDEDCFGAIKGDVEILAFEEEKTFNVKGAFSVGEVDKDDGSIDPDDELGDLEVTISASHCPTLEKSLEETADLFEEAFGG